MKPKEIKEITNSLPQNFQNCFTLLEEEVERGAFTAWSLGNEEYLISSFWADEAFLEPDSSSQMKSQSLNLHPNFDLASLTKPLFLNVFLRMQWAEAYPILITQNFSKFKWHTNIWNAQLIEFVQNQSKLTFNDFLSHKSHFKSWAWLKGAFTHSNTKNAKAEYLEFLLSYYNEENSKEYSDLNYMFLVLLIESLWPNLNWLHEIEKINAILKTNFFHVGFEPQKAKFAIPSFPYILNENTCIKNHKFFGVVHDTNANILASLQEDQKIISGHAGFYGNILDVLKGSEFLQKTQPIQSTITLESRFLYGLDCQKNILGHLGFTGTSFWFQKTEKSFYKNVLLLTNRTATRKSNLKISVPRVYIISNLKTAQNLYYLVEDEKVFKCEKEDIIEKNYTYRIKNHKSWNDTCIPEYKNLNEVRKKIESEIW